MSRKRQIYKASELRNLQKDENSCVSIVPITRRLAIPPSFLNDMKSGIFYFLKSILKKYDRELDGILLGYQNVKLLFDQNTGIVQMGKAETEVNVSVEFFIFQPKIGSCLEGIVNKKSNNHISCLVHKYFNATILKPEDVEFEDWICKDFQINDKITFRVKDLDFTRLLPYIEGTVDKDLLVKCQINRKKNLSFNNETDSVVSTSEKEKNQNEQPDNEERTLVNNYDGEKNDETDGVVKKKKKKKSSVNNFNEFTENCSKEEESNVDISSCGEKDVNEKVYKEKKKKKKKKENRGEECENETFDKTEQLKELMTVENNQKVEENYDEVKVKKKKKKDKKEKKSMKLESKDAKNVENENQTEKGDLSFLYSTQIQPSTTVNKLEMTYCSPIPHEDSLKKKKTKKKSKEKELFKAIINTSQINNLVDEEKEKNLRKLEKRKRKEFELSRTEKSVNSEGCDVSLEKQEDRKTVSGGSEVKDVKVKEEEGEKEDFLKVLEIKRGKESGKFEEGSDVSPKKKIKLSECKDSNETGDKNISGEKPKSELGQNKSVGEADDETPNKPTTETSPKKKDKSVKESPKKINPKSDVKDNKPKSKVQSLLDELLKNQITKVQEQWKNLERRCSESDKESKSEPKEQKKKSKDKKRSLPVEKESSKSEFLYEKLLKDAKSVFSGTTQEVEDKISDDKGIKPSSDLKETGEKSVDSATKKESSKVELSSEKKRKKRKRKASGAEEPKSKKLKNGSMYDMAESSPEKGVKEDKSLFSDSESNMTEKNIPRVNGFASESEKGGKGKIEDLLSDLLKKEMEKLKKSSESSRGEEEVGKKGSKSEKSSKSGKKKKREKGKEKKEKESLYEKLLREAKNLVNAKSEEVPVATKKIRTIDTYFKPA